MVMFSGKARRLAAGSLPVAAVLGVLVLGTPSARSASGCARTPQLAYVAAADAGERGMVWLAAANGSGRKRLFRAARPVLAPGGRMVAVTRFGSPSGLGIFTVCGTPIHRYFSARDGISGLVWSSDASLLAAVVDPHPNGNNAFDQRLVVVDVATGKTITVAKGFLNGFGGPSFSPTAPYQIAYDFSPHTSAHFNVWSAAIGQPGTQLTHGGDNEYPLWGPQGILYSHVPNSGLMTLDLIADGKSTTLMKLNGWPVAISGNGQHLLAEGAACGAIWPLTVDLAARKVRRKLANGFAPFGITASGGSVLIAGSPPHRDCGGRRSRIETVGFARGKPTLIAYGVDPSWAASAAVNVLGAIRGS
jgi:hypothetical protein